MPHGNDMIDFFSLLFFGSDLDFYVSLIVNYVFEIDHSDCFVCQSITRRQQQQRQKENVKATSALREILAALRSAGIPKY